MQYILDGKLDPNGLKTDARARRYQQEHGLTYSQALNRVIREEQVKRYESWPEPNDMNAPIANLEAWKLLAGEAGEAGHDANECARRINALFTPAQISMAAAYALMKKQTQLVSNMSPGKTLDNLNSGWREAVNALPATAAVYSGGDRAQMTAEAAPEMFSINYFQNRTTVHVHSFDKVR